jgi:4-hydroxy-3-methylbut-2-enyl diphosphate reductase
MRVTVAESMGMCFGVRDAVELALDSPHRSDLTVLGELVHNPTVLRQLSGAGVRMVDSVDHDVKTSHVMITAHGASEQALARIRSRGHQVIEATCPLVRHAHRALMRLLRDGYFPVVIGRANHVEVRGLVGDLEQYAVIEGPGDLDALAGQPRLGVISQTTQPIEEVRSLVDQMRARFPRAEVRFVDTVCQPTKDRQRSAKRLAEEVDVVVVVGGRSSNNTRQLALACSAAGARTYQVESAGDLRAEWFAGIDHVGVTAGTSTPDETIQEVVDALHEFGTAHPPPLTHCLAGA